MKSAKATLKVDQFLIPPAPFFTYYDNGVPSLLESASQGKTLVRICGNYLEKIIKNVSDLQPGEIDWEKFGPDICSESIS